MHIACTPLDCGYWSWQFCEHGYSPLQHLTSLKTLMLSNNPIKTADPLKSLVELIFLDLEGIDSLESLDVVSDMNGLERLQIANTNVSNLNTLSEMLGLEYLDTRGTKVTTIEPIAGLKQLKYLLLQKGAVTD